MSAAYFLTPVRYRSLQSGPAVAAEQIPTADVYVTIDLDGFDPSQMAAFYPNLDVIVVPSLNSTETFGLVQVEAMLCGTPSIACNLPGVRQPVLQTRMGEVTPVGDSEALAEAILRIVNESNQQNYIRPRVEIVARFSTERTAAGYEALFERLLEVAK